MNETNTLQQLAKPFAALKNKTFAKLYLAQIISLLGDAFSWVGLALLAYQIDPENSSRILATANTRVDHDCARMVPGLGCSQVHHHGWIVWQQCGKRV